MSPLAIVGILTLLITTATCLTCADGQPEQSGNPPNTNAEAVNSLVGEGSSHTFTSSSSFSGSPGHGTFSASANPKDFWWMGTNSPLQKSYDHFKKCVEKGNCFPVDSNKGGCNTGCGGGEAVAAAEFEASSGGKMDLTKNPFFNGDFKGVSFSGCSGAACKGGIPQTVITSCEGEQCQTSTLEGASKIDLSKNPFFIGTVTGPSSFPKSTLDLSKNPFFSGGKNVVVAGDGQEIEKAPEGFLGVQPSEPFGNRLKSFAITRPGEGGRSGIVCVGNGYLCVPKERCDKNGLTTGEGLLQARADEDQLCDSNTQVCCLLTKHFASNIQESLESLNNEGEKFNGFTQITVGKSSVPGSSVKSTGIRGSNGGLIHVLPNEGNLKPVIQSAGESGAGFNIISTTTIKPVRNVSPNSIFSSTIDYSDTGFNDVHFASTLKGLDYLPPPGPTTPPPKEPIYIPPPIQTFPPAPTPITCTGNSYLVNGKCVLRPTPPPPVICQGNTYLVNGQCVPRPPPTLPPTQPPVICTGNTYLFNGQCVPRPTPPPTPPSIQPPIVCTGNTYLFNGRCVPRLTPPPPTIPPEITLPPIVCTGNTYLLNGICVPRPTPPPPPTPSPTIPPMVCTSNTYLLNGRCVPRSTPPSPIVCTGNSYRVNGQCVPRPTPSTEGYDYTRPSRPFPETATPTSVSSTITCSGNTILINGQCILRPTPPPTPPSLPPYSPTPPPTIICTGNTYRVNGQCVPRPTPTTTTPGYTYTRPSQPITEYSTPPPIACYGNTYLVNGRCIPKPPTCTGNSYLQNGICVEPTVTTGYEYDRPTRPFTEPTPPKIPPTFPLPPTCTGSNYLVNGICVPRPTPPPPPPLQCFGNTYLVNGVCVPRPTPPPPPPPVQCFGNTYLVNGVCVPRPTPPPPPPLQCFGNTYLVNGVCVPRPTPPSPPPLQCFGNTYLVNGVCVPRPTPPPPPPLQCFGNTYLVNGVCVPKPTPPQPPPLKCFGNTYLVNGICVPRPTPPTPPTPIETTGYDYTKPVHPFPGPTSPVPVPTCYGNADLVNGKCVPRTPIPTPPATPKTCYDNTYLENGICVPRPTPPPPPAPTCFGNTYLVNGVCVPRPTPPPPPAPTCFGNTYLANGVCVPRPTPPPPPTPPICVGNTYLLNGVCVLKPTPPPTPTPPEGHSTGYEYPKPTTPFPIPVTCPPNSYFINGACTVRTPVPTNPPPIPTQPLVCVGNTYLVNGQCVSRPTPPPLPPSCTGNTYLVNGQCIPRPTPPPPPVICLGNTYLVNGQCIPRQTSPGYTYPVPSTPFPEPTSPSGGGYVYPKPDKDFDSSNTVSSTIRPTTKPQYLPPTDTAGSSNQFVSSTLPPDHQGQPNVPGVNILPSPSTPGGSTLFPQTYRPPQVQQPTQFPSVSQPIYSGCAAALNCVQEIYCTAEGVISPVPVVLTKEQQQLRVPLAVCTILDTGTEGKCCRDTNYKDPWPSANLINGVDNGQYREDSSLGQYKPQYSGQKLRPTRSGRIQPFSTGLVSSVQPTCGVRNYDTQPKGRQFPDDNFGEIPWQAMILRDSTRTLLCGGAIIRRNAVITAAHCVDGLDSRDVLIKGGEWKLGIDDEPLPFQIIKVAAIIRHPNYKFGSRQNDVALLVLTEKLRLTENVGTICLPQPNQEPTQNCIVTGWGKQVLQVHLRNALMHSIDVNVIGENQCKDILSNKYQDALQNYTSNTYCCQSTVDQCLVDIGSALACTDGSGHYTLSGVFSWDTGCRDESQIGGYIAPDVDWIEATLRKTIKDLRREERKFIDENNN